MNENEHRICRLCLKVTRHDFQAVEEVTREVFDVLLLKTDFSLSESPVMCANCAESIREFFEFKSTCLFTEDRLVKFANALDSSKIDILEVAYIDANQNTNSTLAPGKFICRFCMHCIDKDICIGLDTLEEDFQRDVLSKCVPEIDLSNTGNPAICTACMESLMGYYNFMTTCRDVDKNISDYRQSQGVDNETVNLSSVYRFVLENTLGQDEASGDIVEVKIEKDMEFTIKNEEIEIEMENVDQECTKSNGGSNKRRRGRATKSGPDYTVQLDSEHQPFKCNNCPYTTTNVSHMKRHVFIHKPPSNKPFKCYHCHSGFSDKDILRTHIMHKHTEPSQQTIHKCEHCPYSTLSKQDLKAHMIGHVKVTEENGLKCAHCSFITARRSTLRHHLFDHLNRSRNNTLKCEICTFSTYTKANLRRHMAVHKKGTTYSCELCEYKTTRKPNLNQHMYRHVENRKRLKCDHCRYETKTKSHLIRHMNVHRNKLGRESWKCSKCSFEGKDRVDLRFHMSTHHKDTTDFLKCASCSYHTKFKPSLVQHIVFAHRRHNMELFDTLGQ